jgi:RimJ/RimL family protein N-acetyltransferase
MSMRSSDPEPAATIRRELRDGDLDAIAAHHGAVYAAEYGVDETFEGHVAASLAAAARRGFPGEREAIRIVELGGRHVGSVGLSDEGENRAALRWVLLDPQVRGRGLGRRLIGELVDEAERGGYESIELRTFSELTAAAAIYRELGFELIGSETEPRWGLAEVTYQHYELVFQRRAQAFRSSSTGSSARPFSDSE